MMTSDIPSSKRRSPNGKNSPPSSSNNPLAAAARTGSSMTTTRKNDGGLLTKYFLLILFGFGVLSLIVNTRLAGIVGNSTSSLERYLEDSVNSMSKTTIQEEEDGIPSSSDDHSKENVNNNDKNKKTNARPPPIERQQQEVHENKKKGTNARPPLIERQQQERHEQQQQQQARQREQDDKDFNPSNVEQEDSRLAGLDCQPFGGPDNELAEEMVYWEDIPQDQMWVSPFKSTTTPKYLTFEPDQGGWNNIRMGMVSVIVWFPVTLLLFLSLLSWKTITWVS
jgi:hypothetical protein